MGENRIAALDKHHYHAVTPLNGRLVDCGHSPHGGALCGGSPRLDTFGHRTGSRAAHHSRARALTSYPECARTELRDYGKEGMTMIKLVYCITKKAGLTDEEFFRYWENIHGPIGAQIPRLRKLVQSRRLIAPEDKHQLDFDGMAELWFDDMDALLAARQSAEWEISTADEENFIDHNKVASFVTVERVILDELKET